MYKGLFHREYMETGPISFQSDPRGHKVCSEWWPFCKKVIGQPLPWVPCKSLTGVFPFTLFICDRRPFHFIWIHWLLVPWSYHHYYWFSTWLENERECYQAHNHCAGLVLSVIGLSVSKSTLLPGRTFTSFIKLHHNPTPEFSWVNGKIKQNKTKSLLKLRITTTIMGSFWHCQKDAFWGKKIRRQNTKWIISASLIGKMKH